ncbi:MAG: hypothetical protein LUF28_02365 [Clostridiales bacterium]|nr:hypothetical protein [Clostridiales bacterium]
MKRKHLDELWRYAFPALSVLLWIATIFLFFSSNRTYDSSDYEAQMQIANALRWLPSCFIGALLATVASWVVSELLGCLHSENDESAAE